MRKNWKKVLSLILAVSMVLSMNTSVFATEAPAETPAVEDQTTPADPAPAAEEPAPSPSA